MFVERPVFTVGKDASLLLYFLWPIYIDFHGNSYWAFQWQLAGSKVYTVPFFFGGFDGKKENVAK